MFTVNVNIFQNEQMQVEQANEFIFHVKDSMKIFTMNMDQRTCTCIRFQIDEILCVHATIAIKKEHMDAYE